MISLPSQKNITVRMVILIVVLLSFIFPSYTAYSQSDYPAHHDKYQQYGFFTIGFSSEQEEILEKTLAAFDVALGGHGRLRKIIRAYNHGENWTITYIPDWTGADSSMMLSPTVFSIEKALAANYSTYAALNEVAHAQIVIGHEVSHLLVRAVRNRTGMDWSKIYQQCVTRDWTRNIDKSSPLEEAVTEFSLKVMQADYFFSIVADAIETNPTTQAEISTWADDFLNTLQKLA